MSAMQPWEVSQESFQYKLFRNRSPELNVAPENVISGVYQAVGAVTSSHSVSSNQSHLNSSLQDLSSPSELISRCDWMTTSTELRIILVTLLQSRRVAASGVLDNETLGGVWPHREHSAGKDIGAGLGFNMKFHQNHQSLLRSVVFQR